MATFTVLKRCFSTSTSRKVIQNVTVIGGGLMGSGIAQVAAQSGNNVTLVEVNPDILKKADAVIKTNLGRVAKKLYKEDARAIEKFVDETKARIVGSTDLSEAVRDSDLVVEAIVENLDVKHKLFGALDKAAPPKTLFASNTSSLSIGDIASVTDRKDRFGGLHFFNPVPVMKLLEVVRIPEQSEQTYQAFMAWGKAIGKTCITCKDTPGFVVNRLLVPYLAEAIRMMERGDASPRDIDIAMKLGAGYPMGPIELADYVGHDTTLSIIEGWHKKFPDKQLFVPCESLKEKVREGKLGVKTGEGYYKYNK
ncbi:hydroxyacyl-coenzyme A dehydrogenase, mitochondrial-like [Cylas formicarius]|uniref:hydroxyacyl-coenzyme A dehydrogenase, mitochondrial-like n=1 Tax=Cylas formicarius TaxID=197179 RepID=UPI0029585465|nr:hydroxyacyl-coenzyme A dehydrogenase, mitochondrial-like [Cylas formicarius]XP_060523310.1 hydroxyacyl-coenzyme A dehydrogenase, mitochondrial-like [Cylas formicarius]